MCSIENLDPMGVHTGDSITVAPAQTLSDVEYQEMRDAAFACIRRIGVETGGSNIQFAVNPANGDMVVIEMNPRVSRSSALASKATGFPIAKIAARLAVGYTLDEIRNDITGETPASFEPTIDYVVTKVPRWAFEKFPDVPEVLGTRMQSVGEAMAIGRSFPESLQKALRSLETGRAGLNCDPAEKLYEGLSDQELVAKASVATPDRPFHLEAALRRGVTTEQLHAESGVDSWFLDQIGRICTEHAYLATFTGSPRPGPNGLAEGQEARVLRCPVGLLVGRERGFRQGGAARSRRTRHFQDGRHLRRRICRSHPVPLFDLRGHRRGNALQEAQSGDPGFGAPTASARASSSTTAACRRSFALREAGFETVMVNCNPETVSTDYDTSDRLYFEPVTRRDVQNVLEVEAATGQLAGVMVALGGQTPLKLSSAIAPELVMGTSPASIDLAEDRERWNALCERLGIPQAAGGTAAALDEALVIAAKVGYPVLVRPSYVLGGRAMEIVYGEEDLTRAMGAMAASGSLGREGGLSAERPVLVDKFLEDAVEVDVDAVRDERGRDADRRSHGARRRSRGAFW